MNIYKTRKLLAQQRAFRERQEEAKRNRRMREFREAAEKLMLYKFNIHTYADLQRIKRGINVTKDDIMSDWWLVKVIMKNAECKVIKK